MKGKRENSLKVAIKRRDPNRLRRLADSARTPRRRMLLLFLSELIARANERRPAIPVSSTAVRRAN